MSLFDVRVLREMFAQATDRYGDWKLRDEASDRLIAELGLGGAAESKLFPQLLDAAAERDALEAKLANPRRVLLHESEVVATKDEIASGARARAKLASLAEIHPFHQWGEDDGDVIWHCLPVSETPFHIGRPSDSDWPWDDEDMEDGDFTTKIGWSRLPLVNENVAAKEPQP